MIVERDQIVQYFQRHLLNHNNDLNNHFKAISPNNFIEELTSLLRDGLRHRISSLQLNVIPEAPQNKHIETYKTIKASEAQSKFLSPHKIFGKPRVRLENEVIASPYSNYLISNTKITNPFQKVDINSQTSIAVDFNQRNINQSHFASGNRKPTHHFNIKKEI